MKYKQTKNLKDVEFRRLTGIKKKTFNLMLSILKEAEKEKMKMGGRPPKLSMPNRLLMALEYLREYRTYFHVANSYGISESNCFQAIRWVDTHVLTDVALPRRAL